MYCKDLCLPYRTATIESRKRRGGLDEVPDEVADEVPHSPAMTSPTSPSYCKSHTILKPQALARSTCTTAAAAAAADKQQQTSSSSSSRRKQQTSSRQAAAKQQPSSRLQSAQSQAPKCTQVPLPLLEVKNPTALALRQPEKSPSEQDKSVKHQQDATLHRLPKIDHQAGTHNLSKRIDFHILE